LSVTNVQGVPAVSISTVDMKMEIAGSFETLVTTYQIAWCHDPRDHNLNFKWQWWSSLLKSIIVTLVTEEKSEKPVHPGLDHKQQVLLASYTRRLNSVPHQSAFLAAVS
jgi:hypothetical protein